MTEQSSSGANWRWGLLTHEDMREVVPGERAWLWQGLVPAAGIVLVVGAAMSFKSVILNMLGAAMSRGDGAQLGGLEVAPGRLLYLLQEHAHADHLCHFDRAAAAYELAASSAVTLLPTGFLLEDADAVRELGSFADMSGSRAVVIDSFRACSAADENNSAEIRMNARALADLTREYTRTVILVHHTGKDGSMRGSTDLRAMADSVLTFTRSGERVRIRAEHHGAPTAEVAFRVDYLPEQIAVTGEPTGRPSSAVQGPPEHVEEAIIACCARGPQTTTALREQLPSRGIRISHSRLSITLARLAAQGRLRNRGGGRAHQWEAS